MGSVGTRDTQGTLDVRGFPDTAGLAQPALQATQGLAGVGFLVTQDFAERAPVGTQGLAGKVGTQAGVVPVSPAIQDFVG